MAGLLRFLWLHVPNRSDPVNLSAELLRAGLSRAIRHFEYPRRQEFLDLERRTRNARRSL
ncbi:hypothetical protein [Deferrisoma camini]|uniref:hypothetical protein n=1 Tax=Deferrisoma camini TaxID=1035120 RepID=UPI00046D9383|nr:hypothetical protein [Deferrisoma camini]